MFGAQSAVNVKGRSKSYARFIAPFHLTFHFMLSRKIFNPLSSRPFYTMIMKSDHGGWPFPWSGLLVQLPWSGFQKDQFTKPLGPSLGVNQMWTKRSDHAPKSECVDIFNICPKKAILREEIKFDHSLVFYCLHLLFPPKQIPPKKMIISTFLCHGPLPFSIRAPLLLLPLQNSLDHVSG
jgi:hypothetical protein